MTTEELFGWVGARSTGTTAARPPSQPRAAARARTSAVGRRTRSSSASADVRRALANVAVGGVLLLVWLIPVVLVDLFGSRYRSSWDSEHEFASAARILGAAVYLYPVVYVASALVAVTLLPFGLGRWAFRISLLPYPALLLGVLGLLMRP